MRRIPLAVAAALLAAAGASAFPFPPAPPPAGAVRRFGRPDAPKPRPARPDFRSPTRSEHDPAGAAMTPTPDGKSVLVADDTGRIDVFDLATGRLARRLQAPGAGGVRVVAVSPDGRWLACGRTGGDVQLWDLPAGKPARVLPVGARANENGRGEVQRIAFGPGGRFLVTGVDAYSGGENTGATAWDVGTGRRLWNTPAVGYNLAADPRGRWVLTGIIDADPPQLGLLDAATGRLDRTLVIEPSVQADPDGTTFADATWTLDRLFTPDGARLVTLHGDGTVRVWDPEARREVTRMKFSPARSTEPGGLAGSPDGRWVAIRDDRAVQVWEVASGKRVHTVAGLEGPPRELAFTRDGRGLLTSSGSSPVLWPLRPATLPALDGPADELWAALGAGDAAEAYRLVWALAGDPKKAVEVFRARVRPADLVMARDRFDERVAALDGPRYADRERAEAGLTRAGLTVPAGWLRAALADARSEEVQARLRRVLAAREAPGPAMLRLSRAVQVLEMTGTAEARALLKDWAAGPAGGYLTDEAGAATGRIHFVSNMHIPPK